MALKERLKIILKECELRQKDFADVLELSTSYVSGLMTGRNKAVSPTLAERIENRLGYRAQWILTGEGEKLSLSSESKPLSAAHQQAILHLESMSEAEAKAVLAFLRTLPEIKDAFTK